MQRFHEQLTIPQEVFDQFIIRDINGLTITHIEHVATGKGHKYKPSHWHDFVKAATKPWKAPGFKALTPARARELKDNGLIDWEIGVEND